MISIKTKRLVIKKPKISDRKVLLKHLNNWKVVKWLTRVPFPYLLEDANWWINVYSKEKNNLEFSIYLNDNLIGVIGFRNLEISKEYSIGYWLAEEHWNKGYMTESCKYFLNHMIKSLQIKKIKASYFEGNKASANLLKKFDFKIIGNSEQFSSSKNKKNLHVDLELLIE